MFKSIFNSFAFAKTQVARQFTQQSRKLLHDKTTKTEGLPKFPFVGRLAEMYLRPFRRGKSHFEEVKNGNKRKEFYDSTVRTDDYMRKSGMNRAITLRILLKKLRSGRTQNWEGWNACDDVRKWEFAAERNKNHLIHLFVFVSHPKKKYFKARFPLLIRITYLHRHVF